MNETHRKAVMKPPLALGIDGGASRFKWVAQDDGGRSWVGERTGGNPNDLPWEEYERVLDAAVDGALAEVGGGAEDVASVGLALAGISRPEQRATVARWVRRRLPLVDRCWIGSDALAALRQGAGRLEGVVLLAGTGSICLGVGTAGELVRAGGWGPRLGDEGSGYWIGREALAMTTAMTDGRRQADRMIAEILKHLDLHEPADLVRWSAGIPAGEWIRTVAALTPVVFECADMGSPSAKSILQRAAQSLAGMAFSVADRLPEEESAGGRRLVIAGSLLTQSDTLFWRLREALEHRQRHWQTVRLHGPAAPGALSLGAELGEAVERLAGE